MPHQQAPLKPEGGGGGVLRPEKGTDCGPTTAELWMSLVKLAKKEVLSRHYKCP